MSYIIDYFRDGEYNDIEMSEYEKSFEKIYAHGDEVYHNSEGDGKIFSFTSTIQLENDEEDELIDYGENSKTIELYWSDYNEKNPFSISTGGQRDTRNAAFPKLPIQLYYEDTLLLQFEPMTRTFVIPDIYHNINEFTKEFVQIMRTIEIRWSNSSDTLPESESDKKTILMEGDMYELKKVKDNITNLDDVRERYEKQVNDLREEVELIRSESNISFDRELIQDLQENGIAAYPTGSGSVMFAKQFEIDIDQIADYRTRGEQTYKIPEDDILTMRGSIYFKTRTNSERVSLFPVDLINVYLDKPHPHRNGGNQYDLRKLCTGEIQTNRLETVYDMNKKFNEIIESLRTINLASIMDSYAKVCDTYNTSDYRRIHFLNNLEKYNREDTETYIRDLDLDREEVFGGE